VRSQRLLKKKKGGGSIVDNRVKKRIRATRTRCGLVGGGGVFSGHGFKGRWWVVS